MFVCVSILLLISEEMSRKAVSTNAPGERVAWTRRRRVPWAVSRGLRRGRGGAGGDAQGRGEVLQAGGGGTEWRVTEREGVSVVPGVSETPPGLGSVSGASRKRARTRLRRRLEELDAELVRKVLALVLLHGAQLVVVGEVRLVACGGRGAGR